jgi:hypothetical protein
MLLPKRGKGRLEKFQLVFKYLKIPQKYPTMSSPAINSLSG